MREVKAWDFFRKRRERAAAAPRDSHQVTPNNPPFDFQILTSTLTDGLCVDNLFN